MILVASPGIWLRSRATRTSVVTSDNVLADWPIRQQAVTKEADAYEGFSLRVQEAIDEAHVALYPLDASHLRGLAIGADLGNRNVAVEPGASAP